MESEQTQQGAGRVISPPDTDLKIGVAQPMNRMIPTPVQFLNSELGLSHGTISHRYGSLERNEFHAFS